MRPDELAKLLTDHFGSRVSNIGINPSNGAIRCVLYESFVFVFGLHGEHGTFAGGIEYDVDRYITSFAGKQFSFNPDRESILSNFAIIDEWSRLRLPDKFLVHFD